MPYTYFDYIKSVRFEQANVECNNAKETSTAAKGNLLELLQDFIWKFNNEK